MPFLIKGDAKTIYTAFGQQDYLRKKKKKNVVGLDIPHIDHQIELDIGRTNFFGSADEHAHHLKVWSDPSQNSPGYYTQGDMTSGNLFILFDQATALPLLKKGESPELMKPHLRNICFAYVDENKVPSGLLLYYRKDEPNRWIIGLTKNTNLKPEKRQLFILTSFDPRTAAHIPCDISKADAKDNDLIRALASPKLEKFFKATLTAQGGLNPSADLIVLFIQLVPWFTANDELLDAFNDRLTDILTSKVLKLLLHYGLRPLPQQVLACLDPESELYRLISDLKPGVNEKENQYQLEILLKLDEYGLNTKQQLIRGNKNFVALLHSFANKENDEFLSLCLADEQKTKGLKFIGQSRFHSDFFRLLKNRDEPEIWENLAQLADCPWQFPKDEFRHNVICSLLLNEPTISAPGLLLLSESLLAIKSLEHLFDPRELADFLIKNAKPGILERLADVGYYFNQVLTSYEEAASLRRIPLSKELLRALGSKYLQNPHNNLLEKLYFCNSVEQIDAGYVLQELDLDLKNFPAYLLNPVLVSTINELKICDLQSCIESLLTDGMNSLVLLEINKLENRMWQRAGLILFAQQQLDKNELVKLKETFNRYPYLGSLINELHSKKFSAEQLRKLAFEPSLHCTARFLSGLQIEFSFEELTPVVRQLMLAIVELIEPNKGGDQIKDYLKAVIPSVLQYFKQEIQVDECFATIQGECSLFAGTKQDQSTLGEQLNHLLSEQLYVAAMATKLAVPENQQLMQTSFIAKELASALRLLDQYLLPEGLADSVEGHIRADFYKQLFAGFSALPATCKLTDSIRIKAVEALISCHLQAPENPLVPLDLLLQNPVLAGATLQLTRHGLSAAHLLALDNPLRDEIALSLMKLSILAPKSMPAYELALQANNNGHDFRLLLARTTPIEQPQPLLEDLLYNGIQERRISTANKTIARLDDKQIRQMAYKLDESLILINRLRRLAVDDNIIDFMMRSDERGQQFYRAVLRVETECQSMRSRLKKEANLKYQALVEPERAYRKAMYQAIYEEFNPSVVGDSGAQVLSLAEKIKLAETELTAVVNIDRHPWLRTAMMIITNIVTFALLGIPNVIHKQNTGDLLFFARPASSETTQRLKLGVLAHVAESMAAPAA